VNPFPRDDIGVSERSITFPRAVLGHGARLGVAAVVVASMFVGGQVTGGAAGSSPGCTDPTPYGWLPTSASAPSQVDDATLAATARQKIALDAVNPGLQSDLAGAAAASASPAQKQAWVNATRQVPASRSELSMDAACKAAGAQQGSLLQRFQQGLAINASAAGSTTYGNGYAWLNNFNHQGQINGYYCGPATIAEGTTTLGVGVSQQTAGSYMGTNTGGTGTTAMTNGMVHFIGNPVFGWSFYVWHGVPYTPTQTDYNNYFYNITSDISGASAAPIAGDAYEVVGGPHLVGHPNQNIFHWFETGGWNQNGHPGSTSYYTIYYADSATSIWSTVPAYSWFNMQTMVVILGGRGYVW
jgi:hypothetical protein